VLAFGAAGAACVINVLQHPHLLAESDRIRRAIIRERLPADHLAERDAASWAFAARGGVVAVDWGVVIPFTATAMAGSLLGNWVAGRVPASVLVRAFVGLLVLLALYVATRSILGLV
jgi:hypothetical protein